MTVSSLPSGPFPPPSVPPARRPGGLTAVFSIAIVLGGMGLLGSLTTFVSLVAGPQLQQAFILPLQQRGGDKMAEAQRAMQQKIQVVADRYRWPSTGFAVVDLGLATALIAGGVMGLKRASRAGTLLIATFAVAILLEIPRIVVNVCMQYEMSAVMLEMMPSMLDATPPADHSNSPQAVGRVIAQVSIAAGVAFMLVFCAAKLVYYVVGWRYLCRPAIRSWLASPGDELQDGT